MSRHKPPTSFTPRRSPRQLRVGEELRHVLAAALQKGDFPWDGEGKRPVITITEVRISPDLRNAIAFIIPLGGGNAKVAETVLNRHVHYYKNEIAHNMNMRYIPQLHFSADSSFEYADKIERILHDPAVARDLSREDNDA